VGDPCTPEQEYDPCFAGFNEAEVNVESKSFQCQTRLCLVNHFQGRVSCPYGQNAGTSMIGGSSTCAGFIGGPPITPTYAGTGTCAIPGAGTVIGDSGALSAVNAAYQVQVSVPPQIFERNAAKTVYCSCRCENADGLTNDGSVYCSCPDGYVCQQLVTSIGGQSEGLTGGYCILNNPPTVYIPQQLGSQAPCDPTYNKCSLPE
jgi:hypothetical protein